MMLRLKNERTFVRVLIAGLIMMLISCYKSYCQEVEDVDKWMLFIEELVEGLEADDESIEKIYNDLSYLSENPFNLNHATEEQLKQIPFLSDVQILSILDYLKSHREFVSIYELKNIRFLFIMSFCRKNKNNILFYFIN